jgi:hypothetical protein
LASVFPCLFAHVFNNAALEERILSKPGESDGLADAPKPLLPTYGMGNATKYLLDITMMVIANAKERTLDEFKQLG